MPLDKFLNNIAYLYLIDQEFQKISDLSGINWGSLPDYESVRMVQKYLTLLATNPHKVAMFEMSADISYLEKCGLDLTKIGKDEEDISIQFQKAFRNHQYASLARRLAANPDQGSKILSAFDVDRISAISTESVTEFLPTKYCEFLEQQKLGHERVIIPGFEQLSKMIGGFNFGRVIMLLGETGFGKCLGKGTEILMHDGSIKKVENIAKGDFLMGPDSGKRKVLSIARGKEQLYKINLINGDSFVCNESHILSLRNGVTKEIVNIDIKSYLALNKTKQRMLKSYKVGVEFKKASVPLDPYFAGVWLGDGTFVKPEITTPEPEIKKFVTEYAKSLGLVVRVYQGKGCEQLNITKGFKGSNKKSFLGEQIEKFKLNGEKFIPDNYLINDREIRLQLLAGIADTDGYTFKNTIEISSKYKKLSEQIAFLARSLGFRTTSRVKIVKGKEYYLISISGDTETIPIKIKRKKPSERMQIKASNVYGFKIEKLSVGDYYGFEIDKDRLFVLGDFTVTHNTNLAINLLIRAATKSKCLFINMEMPLEDIMKRLVVLCTQKSFKSLYAGEISHESAVHDLKAYGDNLKFTKGFSLTLQSIESLMRKEKENGLDFVVIDYDQKIELAYSKNIPEWKLLQIAIQHIENLSKELHVCVILLAQVNREGTVSSSHRATFTAHTILNFKGNDSNSVYDKQANAIISAVKNRHGKKDQACLVQYSEDNLNIKEITVVDYKKPDGVRREKTI